jgi:hypothetical protein
MKNAMNTAPFAPTVSVLIPVYNGGSFFADALQSILEQSFADFECIVVDDGSTDGSGALAEAIAARDGRFRVVRRENRGLVATLNELVSLARGELLARMDADDIALCDRLALQVAFMNEHPEVVCVGGGQILMDETGRLISSIAPPTGDDDIQQLTLRGHGSICHPTAMIRKGALLEVGGYRSQYYPAEDLDLWLRLGERGKLANLAVPVLHYRIHSGSISGQAAQGRQRAAGRHACQDAWERRGVTDVTFEASGSWRPTEERESRLLFALQYGWMAHSSGFRDTAVAYGLKAFAINPLRTSTWRLLVAAVFKRPRGST